MQVSILNQIFFATYDSWKLAESVHVSFEKLYSAHMSGTPLQVNKMTPQIFIFFCKLRLHAKCQNHRTIPSGRKVKSSEEERGKMNNSVNTGHFILPSVPEGNACTPVGHICWVWWVWSSVIYDFQTALSFIDWPPKILSSFVFAK